MKEGVNRRDILRGMAGAGAAMLTSAEIAAAEKTLDEKGLSETFSEVERRAKDIASNVQELRTHAHTPKDTAAGVNYVESLVRKISEDLDELGHLRSKLPKLPMK